MQQEELLNKFKGQRFNAIRRNIKWELSFEEWLSIWEASKVLHLRGRGKGRYCMSRFGDKGPYKVGNVFIQLTGHNTSQALKGKQLTKEQKAKRIGRVAWNKGKTIGPHSEEHKAKLSAAQRGIPKSPEHVAKVAAALRARHA